MVNLKLLNEKIDNSGMTKTAIARKMGISRETLYQKTQGESEWTINNMETFSRALHLTEQETKVIFLSSE